MSIKRDGICGNYDQQSDSNAISEAMTNFDLLIYAGHGDGRKFINHPLSLLKNDCRSAILLFGCSSIKFQRESYFEAEGMLLMMISKCVPVVGGFLWPIFDTDCDLFTIELLKNIKNESQSRESLSKALVRIQRSNTFKALNPYAFVIYGMEC